MELDRDAIMRIIPHRPPFLFVDRITAIEESRIVGTLQVTGDEWFFPGHFPGRPVMPGVLILECMAQAAGILVFRTLGKRPDDKSVYYYAGIDNARFKRPVEPGDQLVIEVAILGSKRGIWKFGCTARVADNLVAEADILCTVRPAGGDGK